MTYVNELYKSTANFHQSKHSYIMLSKGYYVINAVVTSEKVWIPVFSLYEWVRFAI